MSLMVKFIIEPVANFPVGVDGVIVWEGGGKLQNY